MSLEINIKPIRGFDKNEILNNFDLFKPNAVPNCNSTRNWEKAGKPMFGTKAFKQFCIEELIKKTKLTPGLGCYVEIEHGHKDTRSRPFELIKPKTASGIKNYKLKYLISEVTLDKTSQKNDENDIISIGSPVVYFNTLGEAKEAVKDLTSETKKDYVIQSIKIPDDSVKIISKYKASKNAKIGTYVLFGINFKNEKENEYTLYNKES